MEKLVSTVQISKPSPPYQRSDHLRVDGKFFAQGRKRVRLHGVTYGPFSPDLEGHQFPAPQIVREDFARMRQRGINSIRTYHLPPEWFLNLAEECEIFTLIDIPWHKHICFLESVEARKDARRRIQEAVEIGRAYPSIAAFSIGNEIPTDIARWHGARNIERFLAELCDVAKQADPERLVTYANYPSTEYLDLSFLDFLTVNVYLHDLEEFSRYLFRLQHLAGDKPLVLGEVGMDTLRQGEEEQAHFLSGHLREAQLTGLAGTFVFSWTDDWFTGGHQIEDWAFGLTRADRSPKPALEAVSEVYERSPAELLNDTPAVSVVVCSYNGGQTLDQCLQSLTALDYPTYEVILVDDGSTDDTQRIAARYPDVLTLHQENLGLSVARNVGLQASSGSIVAYTDSDCFVDPDWLTQMVFALQRNDAVAVGGPNLAPEDGWRAACIAASPGQPTHVMENDQVAEHIPGCNMAFRRDALESINGFDPEYWRAGDDVDVCWRLQQAGKWIAFAPGAFVWHHRRQTIRTYLKQQRGYGEAEALLRFKHPDRFNGRGDGKWRGVIYGSAFSGLRLAQSIIYRGAFGTGLFQCVYQPGSAHWAMLPGTLEWHGAAALVGVMGFIWKPAWALLAGMIGLSGIVAGLQAAQAKIDPSYDSLKSRLVVMGLCYTQPLVRSWKRYLTRMLSCKAPRTQFPPNFPTPHRLPLNGLLTVEYWSEDWKDRTELLAAAADYLKDRQWARTLDTGWSVWDMEVYCHPWTAVQIRTVQEDHGSGKRLIRVRYRLRFTGLAKTVAALGIASTGGLCFIQGFSATVCAGLVSGVLIGAWWKGAALASQVTKIFDQLGAKLGLTPCKPVERKAPDRKAERGNATFRGRIKG